MRLPTCARFLCCLFAILTARPLPAADPAPLQPLSPPQLDVLVSGIAFYPDPIIEQILLAAQDTTAIHAAATGQWPTDQWPASVVGLQRYPEILAQLDQHLPVTARLGLAAQAQLPDVWAAIDRVRTQFDQSLTASSQPVPADGGTDLASSGGGAYGAVPYAPGVYGAFAAGVVAANAVDYYQYQTAGGGTATAGVVSGSAQVGDTTYYGAAGAGSVTTANGTTVNGAGQVHGSVSQTDTGAAYHRQSSGVVVNPQTGAYGAGTRTVDGSAQTNPDGSTSFSRSAATNTQSSYGSTSIQHNGSGTYTGTGSGSYQGGTDIQSTHGNASVETQAGNGQVTTTVTTDNGSQQFTAGDGTVQHAPATTSGAGSTAERSTARTSGQADARYSNVSPGQLNAANQALQSSWGQISRQLPQASFSRPSGTSAPHNQLRAQGQTLPTQSLRAGNGGAQPQRQFRGNGGGGGGRGGRRR